MQQNNGEILHLYIVRQGTKNACMEIIRAIGGEPKKRQVLCCKN